MRYYKLFFVSISLLIYEFFFAKLLDYALWPPSSLIVISLLMIGYSLGCILVKVSRNVGFNNSKIIFSLSVSIIAVLLLSNKFIYFGYRSLEKEILLIVLIGIIPFILFGLYFATLFTASSNLGQMLAVHMIGLAVGAYLAPSCYKIFGLETMTILISCSLLFILFLGERQRKKIVYLLFLLILVFSGGVIKLDYTRFIKYKHAHVFHDNSQDNFVTIEKTKYTYFSRVDAVSINKQKFILTDGNADTGVYKKFSDVRKMPRYYLVYPYRKHDEVLIIGPGGGNDIATALKGKAKQITAVELNSATIGLMENFFRSFSGHLYANPKVKIINKEGRAYIENTPRKFDLIVLQGTDTGIYRFNSGVRLENYLYTQEALSCYWDALSSQGTLYISRPAYLDPSSKYPKQTLLLYLTLQETLAKRGIEINEHLVVMQPKDSHEIIILLCKEKIKSLPYPQEILQKINILKAPGYPRILDSQLMELKRELPLSAITDDRPAFYVFRNKLHDLGFITKIIVPLLFICLLIAVLRFGAAKGSYHFSIFVLLGAAYIILELNLIEKIAILTGDPVASYRWGLPLFLISSGMGAYLGTKISLKKAIASCFIVSILILAIPQVWNYIGIGSYLLTILLYFPLVAVVGILAGIPYAHLLQRQDSNREFLIAFDAAGTIAGGLIIWFTLSHFGFSITMYILTILYIMIGLGISLKLIKDQT